jgi:hypothetical protein
MRMYGVPIFFLYCGSQVIVARKPSAESASRLDSTISQIRTNIWFTGTHNRKIEEKGKDTADRPT